METHKIVCLSTYLNFLIVLGNECLFTKQDNSDYAIFQYLMWIKMQIHEYQLIVIFYAIVNTMVNVNLHHVKHDFFSNT